MASDPSIYNTIGQPQSFVDAARSFGQLRSDQQQRGMNALLMRQRQAEMDAADQQRTQANALLNFERNTAANLPADQLPDAYQRAGYITQAEALRAKRAATAKDAAEAGRASTQDQTLKRAYLMQGLNGMTDREAVKQHLASGVQQQVFGMQEAKALMDAVPTDPTQFQQWRDSLVVGPDKVQDNIRADAALVESRRAREAADATARRGQDMTRDAVNQRVTAATERASAKAANVKLSPTEQRELFEADDMTQAGQNTLDTLKKAMTLNDKTYSGAGANLRATVRSNLPGDSSTADNTLELDNLMTGQALESLKATFGAMPTEGERKVLLDMQGMSSKPPAVRKQIIEQAMAVAQRRLDFNKAKAKALREGTYATEGVGLPPPAPLPPTGAAAAAAVSNGRRTPLIPPTVSAPDPAASAALFNAADAILRGGR